MPYVRHFIVLSVLILFGFFLNGCQNEIAGPNDTGGDEPLGSGQIRFIHCASSASELDIAYKDLTDGQYYTMQAGASYGNPYGYFDFYVGERNFIVYPSNTDIVIASGTVTLSEGQKVSLIAIDYEATVDPDLLVLEDTLAIPAAGYAYVRFIHAGADGETIKISETDSATAIAILKHLDNSGYLKLEARTYKFNIQSNQSQQSLIQSVPLTFLSGQCYSVIFSGSYQELTPLVFNAKVYRETSL